MKVKGGGARKTGRNKETCAKYRLGHRKEKNKIRKYKKMLKKLQDNKVSITTVWRDMRKRLPLINPGRYEDKEFNLFDRPTRDHVIPISKGGNNTKENIVPACGSCNSKKKDKILL